MAKESGLGMTVSVDDAAGAAQAIGGDVVSVNFTMPSNVQDITSITKSAYERIYLLADFSLSLNGVFNAAADLSHDVFKSVGPTSVTRTVSIAISGQTLATEDLFTAYRLSRAADGSLMWEAPGHLNSTTVPVWT